MFDVPFFSVFVSDALCAKDVFSRFPMSKFIMNRTVNTSFISVEKKPFEMVNEFNQSVQHSFDINCNIVLLDVISSNKVLKPEAYLESSRTSTMGLLKTPLIATVEVAIILKDIREVVEND